VEALARTDKEIAATAARQAVKQPSADGADHKH
jgi:hypothetical protein